MTCVTAVDSVSVAQINGVRLFTKQGIARSRYSDEERLQILGGTWDEIDAFTDALCPDEPLFAATRGHSENPRDWRTPKGRLRDRDVLCHLLADRLPGKFPYWVAPRSWEVTRVVAIDVDFRGNLPDFKRRCRQVERGLRRLGVPSNLRLDTSTPSGGKHYRFFLRSKILVRTIPHVMAMVGLEEASGRIEIFPSMSKGLRLPFGHTPGCPRDPNAWRRFAQQCLANTLRRVSWRRCVRRAQNYAQRQMEAIPHPERPSGPPVRNQQDARSLTGRRQPHDLAPGLSIVPGEQGVASQRYLELLSRPLKSRQEAQELWSYGILAPGTRVAATKVLAWHLIRACGMNVEEASSRLANWVLQTGKLTSCTVKNDLANRSNQVERQTKSIVAWVASRERSERPELPESRSHLSRTEVDQVLKCVESLPFNERLDHVTFALSFLRYSKLHGVASAEGWGAMVAVDGVMKRWPNCRSSNKYRRKLDFFQDCGLIEQTREKLQTPNGAGRPRTYLIRIAPIKHAEATWCMEFALAYAAKSLAASNPERSIDTTPKENNDEYRRFVKPISKRVSDSKMEAALNSPGVTEGRWPTLDVATGKLLSLSGLAEELANRPLSQLPLNKYKLKVEGPQAPFAPMCVIDASTGLLATRLRSLRFTLSRQFPYPKRSMTRPMAGNVSSVLWAPRQRGLAVLCFTSQGVEVSHRPRPPTTASGPVSRTAHFYCNLTGASYDRTKSLHSGRT